RTPKHPYTIGLLSTRAHGGHLEGKRLKAIPGSPPDLTALPPGCAFAPRCDKAIEACNAGKPPVVDCGGGQLVRCIRAGGGGA
ncbi:MAG: oligopeptide/dipeptide ABC transporter ATP-binding protein, partial [Hyphomicrobiaceae bacterium]